MPIRAGLRIKQRRNELHMTMDQLAERTGYTSPSRKTIIYQIEIGKTEISFSRLAAFAEALKTSVYYLLEMTDIKDATDVEILKLLTEDRNNRQIAQNCASTEK